MNTQRRNLLKLMTTGVAVITVPLAITTSLSACSTHSNSKSVTHTVEIQKFKFVPATINIKAGDTIRWINRDLAPHTATASDNSWDTGLIKTNKSKSITFDKNAINSYFCTFHPGMKAAFTVTTSN